MGPQGAESDLGKCIVYTLSAPWGTPGSGKCIKNKKNFGWDFREGKERKKEKRRRKREKVRGGTISRTVGGVVGEGHCYQICVYKLIFLELLKTVFFALIRYHNPPKMTFRPVLATFEHQKIPNLGFSMW